MRNLALLFLLCVATAFPQSNPAWSRPAEPHKIVGNLHYVGTEDLACFLLTTPEGHILINTGLPDSTPLIRASVEKLGFKLQDVKILLTMQAHLDHVGALAEIQKLSGARVMITEGDAASVEDGGASDPAWGASVRFPAVKVDRRLRHGDTVELGGTRLRVISTPGHSRGSVSYELTAPVRALIVNMPTVVMPLKNDKYPEIVRDLETTLARLKALKPDVWVAAHASQYDLASKLKKRSFSDPEGYRKAVESYERSFAEERQKLRR